MIKTYQDWLNENNKEKERAKAKGMCVCCDPDSSHNTIFQDSLTGAWYLDIETSEWDSYDDGYVHIKEYINYCPYCSRDLYKDDKNE